jgi:3'-phosphoadenosine 5'-phosphosulfate sulfotransferase (PAPS reductase)/FAD synthetase
MANLRGNIERPAFGGDYPTRIVRATGWIECPSGETIVFPVPARRSGGWLASLRSELAGNRQHMSKPRLNLFGLSGGKDSTRMVGWAIHESGYPLDSLRFVFCDTENEYEEVYDQIRALDAYVQKHGCCPVVTLKAKGNWTNSSLPVFLALCVWKGRFPSAKARFCTDHLKIKPTGVYIEELIAKGYEIVNHSGVRKAESFERSVMTEWATDMFGCRTRRPILNETIADIWDAHRRHKLPINKLYRLGWKRVGCRLCIMSSKADVYRTQKLRPWAIDIYEQWEAVVSLAKVAKNSITDFSSWFHCDKVPECQRTKTVKTKNKGDIKVATIRDVVRWSQTLHGGTQGGFDFMFEEENYDVDDAHNPCQSGYCE